jgi:hypothetical protein
LQNATWGVHSESSLPSSGFRARLTVANWEEPTGVVSKKKVCSQPAADVGSRCRHVSTTMDWAPSDCTTVAATHT